MAQASAPVVIVDRSGPRTLPGSADRAAAVIACSLRFVLDRSASDECRELLATGRRALLDPDDPPRMPAADFWLEWIEDDGRRTGALVRSDADGRCGTIETFWEQASGDPDRAQAVVRFDLDQPIAGEIDGEGCVALRPAAHPLARHLVFEIEERWLAHFMQDGEQSALRCAEIVIGDLVPGIEMLLAFAALLSARPVLTTREVDQSRLNRARMGSGRPPLLDHVEVRLDLAYQAVLRSAGITLGRRERARLHPVRGHMVRRGNIAFWRRAHLRGKASRPLVDRTPIGTRNA